MNQNHYDVLGVARDAASADIAAAHREAIARAYRQTPPDAERLAAIHEAHRILSDDAQRRVYDSILPAARKPLVRPRRQAAASVDASQRDWLKWVVGLAVALVVIGWWQERNKKPLAPRIDTSMPTAPVTTPPVAAPPPETAETEKTSQEMFALLGTSVGRVVTGRGSGSGVVIAANTVITNCHVVMPWSGAQIEFSQRQSYATELIVADEELDLCKMNVPGLRAKPVTIGSVADVSNRQTVFAIGAPGGGPIVISEGQVTTLHGITAGNVIQTTAYVRPGSSGGGLFSATGRLIGIVTFQQRGLEEQNYAIPVDWLSRMETRPGSGQHNEVVPPVYR